MLSIASILRHVKDNIHVLDRYQIIDDEHVLDTHTGAKFHLYDDWFKITYADKMIVRASDLAPHEQEIIWELKQTITDPSLVQQRLKEYPEKLRMRREHLSKLFEHPQPVAKPVEVEEETVEYMG